MWFEQLFGFHEVSPEQVRSQLELEEGVLTSLVNGASYQCGSLETPKLADLQRQTQHLENTGDPSSICEWVGDVQELHCSPACAGALFQVASQFNLLEMVGPSVTPEQGVARYENDRTQGPACAIACGAGTVYRNYFARTGSGQIGQTAFDQIDCLADIGALLGNHSGAFWEMQNGYALASLAGLERIAGQLSLQAERACEMRSELRVGLHWDCEVTLKKANGNTVSQAYCSAMPVSYSREPAYAWEPFARLILEGAYEATFRAALLNRERTGSADLYLTLLGGGAFGNGTQWILDAISRAFLQMRNAGLRCHIVSYGYSNSDVAQLVDSLMENGMNTRSPDPKPKREADPSAIDFEDDELF